MLVLFKLELPSPVRSIDPHPNQSTLFSRNEIFLIVERVSESEKGKERDKGRKSARSKFLLLFSGLSFFFFFFFCNVPFMHSFFAKLNRVIKKDMKGNKTFWLLLILKEQGHTHMFVRCDKFTLPRWPIAQNTLRTLVPRMCFTCLCPCLCVCVLLNETAGGIVESWF